MKKIKILTALVTVYALLVNTTPVAAKSELYFDYIQEIADAYDVAPELIQSMIYYESNYNPNAVSKDGAVGLMQIIPKYNKDRMKRLGVTDLYDPYSNILVGTDILMELAETNEVYLALTAYNCGIHSDTYKRVADGGSWEYADKILEMTAELERKHNK